jgi:starch phosphorylase
MSKRDEEGQSLYNQNHPIANHNHPIASIPEPQRAAWKKHSPKPFSTTEDFEREVVRHVETTLARSMFNCDETAAYAAASLAFRDRLITEWNRTQQRQTLVDSKRVYYLSLEFLMGRALDNAMLNVGLKDLARSEFMAGIYMRITTNSI